MIERKPFTDALLRKLTYDGRRSEITDAGCRGLRIRVSETGQRTFVLKARDSTSRLKTVTLGHYPELTLRQARDAAIKARLDLKAGKDINGEKRQLRDHRTHNPSPTLGELIIEYEGIFCSQRKSWQPRGKKSTRSRARAVIEAVLDKLLTISVADLTLEQLGSAINGYKPKQPINGKKTANGQASRARAYLMPVLDWAAGRKAFSKIGAGRTVTLNVISLEQIHDPASKDPSISGDRERVLTEDELRRILPWLVYPPRQEMGLRIPPEHDFRPIAMRFLLLTASRREEVENMQWHHLDLVNGVWQKQSVKSTRGGPRGQKLPLSPAAIDLLKTLPGYGEAKSTGFVFPNSKGGKLDNWPRVQKALYSATGTAGWHRHDLRRTAATVMHALKVPVSTIDQILGHTNPLKREDVSGAASHYLRLTKVMKNIRDPQEEALDELAAALSVIEATPDNRIGIECSKSK